MHEQFYEHNFTWQVTIYTNLFIYLYNHTYFYDIKTRHDNKFVYFISSFHFLQQKEAMGQLCLSSVSLLLLTNEKPVLIIIDQWEAIITLLWASFL